MKYSEVYLKAAELVDSGFTNFSGWDDAHHAPLCGAVCHVEKGGWLAIEPAWKVFMQGNPHKTFWFGSPFSKMWIGGTRFERVSKKVLEKRQAHRVFALLLMAELAKDQGL